MFGDDSCCCCIIKCKNTEFCLNDQCFSVKISFFYKKSTTFAGTMMNWQQLISNKRLGQESRHPMRHDDRTEFKRDYDRLIFSAPFRRLQNKTQVFPLPGSVFVHNRLTHSLEVASVGMSLGSDVAAALMQQQPALKETMIGEIINRKK